LGDAEVYKVDARLLKLPRVKVPAKEPFRHTFATVACQMGWNFERLRAAMGHVGGKALPGFDACFKARASACCGPSATMSRSAGEHSTRWWRWPTTMR
jgi:hypothetical protein